jgi:zinc and cadmium transporter
MTPEALAAVYCIVIFFASLLGGWLPRLFHFSHGRMQLAISFVAGVVLGIGILHLLPHGFLEFREADAARAIDRAVWWLLIGFLTTFFLQRLFHFHTHEAPDALIEREHPAADDMQHAHSHGECKTHDHAHSAGHDHVFTWWGVFFGLTVHSLIDGVTLAAAIQTEWEHAEGVMLAGFGFFLAVVLHKPFDSLSITSLMLASGWSPAARNAANLVYALVAPTGVLLFFVGLPQAGDAVPVLLGATLCFAAGACLCISSSDLLPELQFHSHDRLKLSLALVLGLALAWGIVFIENQGHGHHSHAHGETREGGEAETDHDHPPHGHSHDHRHER